MKTLTEKYRGVLNESFSKKQFVRDAQMAWPQLITQFNGFEDTVTILKQKGMIAEEDKAPQYADYDNISDDAIKRGIDAELTAAGVDSASTIAKEDYEKAREKAVKNLKKDPLHYINLLSGESNKVDKHDKMVEPSEKNKVDTFNGMKKADLKESKTLKEMTVDLISYLKKEKGADNEMIKDFIKTHFNDIKGMSLDQIGDEYDNFVSVNYEAPSDFMQEREVEEEMAVFSSKEEEDKYIEKMTAKTLEKEKAARKKKDVDEALSDEDMKAIEKYGHADKTVKPFKPGDMFSTDFDYEGMLEFGLKIRLNTPIATLQALYDSFEDVNYHSENSHLGMAIDAIKDGDKSEALDHIRNFKKEVKKTLVGINEGADPSRKQMEEKKGKDHDGDGDIDGDDYMAAKDKAIKKAMGKDKMVKENLKAIIQKVLEEQVINEAATQELAKFADQYGGFDGMKAAIIQLQDIVTDIEAYYDKTRTKIQKIYNTLGDIRNEEGLKVGGFLAPAIENAFNKDLRPVTKVGFTKGLDQPKVRVISQRDIDRHNSGEAPLGEAEPAKDTVYTPPVNGTLRETKK